jgi:hypothetical protein
VTTFLVAYLGGVVATLVASCLTELRLPADQRRPLSSLLGLALLWPLYLLFLGAVAVSARRH